MLLAALPPLPGSTALAAAPAGRLRSPGTRLACTPLSIATAVWSDAGQTTASAQAFLERHVPHGLAVQSTGTGDFGDGTAQTEVTFVPAGAPGRDPRRRRGAHVGRHRPAGGRRGAAARRDLRPRRRTFDDGSLRARPLRDVERPAGEPAVRASAGGGAEAQCVSATPTGTVSTGTSVYAPVRVRVSVAWPLSPRKVSVPESSCPLLAMMKVAVALRLLSRSWKVQVLRRARAFFGQWTTVRSWVAKRSAGSSGDGIEIPRGAGTGRVLPDTPVL